MVAQKKGKNMFKETGDFKRNSFLKYFSVRIYWNQANILNNSYFLYLIKDHLRSTRNNTADDAL